MAQDCRNVPVLILALFQARETGNCSPPQFLQFPRKTLTEPTEWSQTRLDLWLLMLMLILMLMLMLMMRASDDADDRRYLHQQSCYPFRFTLHSNAQPGFSAGSNAKLEPMRMICTSQLDIMNTSYCFSVQYYSWNLFLRDGVQP